MCCKAADPTPAEVVRGTAGVRKGFNVPRMEHRKVRKFRGAGIELNCVDYGGEGRTPMLLGHSMGGHSVMVYAVEHSQRLRAMVAIDSIPAYPEHAISALAAIADRP